MADNQNLIATLARSGRMRIAAALVVTALVGGGLGVIMLRGDEGAKKLLYSGLDIDEAAEITNRLDTANIRNWLEGGGAAVYVEASKVDDARMMLSEQGLPTRGSVGWEIFDKTEALGATSFVQNINKTRALEGELERSIGALDMVKAARVHLAIPDKPLFQRDNQQPTASVILQLTGNSMTPGKVWAIQNLVAMSVPGLSYDHVSVVDATGRMLARAVSGTDAGGESGVGADERKQALENDLRQKVLDIVENIVGSGAAKVSVTMDVDFNRVTQTAEEFNPDSRVLRSSSTTEETSKDIDSQPGDTTTVANNLPTGAQPPNANQPKSQAETTSTTETANYEISKTVRTEIIDGGRVKNLSVSVVLDHQRVPGADGAPATFTPRTPEEKAQILQLVKTAVGFNEDRGDVVTVENLPFDRPDVNMGDAKPPGAFDFDKFDVVRGVEIGALFITALALVLFVLRPLVRGLMSKPQRSEEGPFKEVTGPDGVTRVVISEGHAPQQGGTTVIQTVAAQPGSGGGQQQQHQHVTAEGKTVTFDIPTPERLDAGIDVARISGQVKASSIKKISEVVSSHPDESLAIIRSWLAEEGRERAA